MSFVFASKDGSGDIADSNGNVFSFKSVDEALSWAQKNGVSPDVFDIEDIGSDSMSAPTRTPEQIAQQGESEYDAMMRQISAQQGGGVDEALQRAFPRTMSQMAPQTLLEVAAWAPKQAIKTALDIPSALGRVLASIPEIASGDPAAMSQSIGQISSENAGGAILRDPLIPLTLAAPGGQLIGFTRLGSRVYGAEAPIAARVGEAVGKGAAEAGAQGALTSFDRPVSAPELGIVGMASALTNRYGVTPESMTALSRQIARNRIKPTDRAIRAAGGRIGTEETDALLSRNLLAGNAEDIPEAVAAEKARIGGRLESAVNSPYFRSASVSDEITSQLGDYPARIKFIAELDARGAPVTEIQKAIESMPEEQTGGVIGRLLKDTYATVDGTNVPVYGAADRAKRLESIGRNSSLYRDLTTPVKTIADMYQLRKLIDEGARRAGSFSKSTPELAAMPELYKDARTAVNDIVNRMTELGSDATAENVAKVAKEVADERFAKKYGTLPPGRENTPEYLAEWQQAAQEAQQAMADFSGAIGEYRQLLPWEDALQRASTRNSNNAQTSLLSRVQSTRKDVGDAVSQNFRGLPAGSDVGTASLNDAQILYNKAQLLKTRQGAKATQRGAASTGAIQSAKAATGTMLARGGAQPVQVVETDKKWSSIEEMDNASRKRK